MLIRRDLVKFWEKGRLYPSKICPLFKQQRHSIALVLSQTHAGFGASVYFSVRIQNFCPDFDGKN